MAITSGEVGLGGLLVGAAGLLAGQLQTGRADKRAERRLHAQWLRDRRADAYVELLSVAEKCGQWVQIANPMASTGPQSPPPLASLDEQGHAEAVLRAFASVAVRECWNTWRDTVRNAITQDTKLRFAERARAERWQPAPGNDTASLLQHLDDVIRVSEMLARKRLGAAVFADIDPDTAPPTMAAP